MSGFPFKAIEKAVADFANGRVPDFNNDFPPSAARLAERIRSYVPRRSGEQLALAYENEIPDDERARVSDKLLALAAQIGQVSAEEREADRKRMAAKMQQANDRLLAQDTRSLEERLGIVVGSDDRE